MATLGLQHGGAIRWSRWRDDARLHDGARLTQWMTIHGVYEHLLAALYGNPFPFDGGRIESAGEVPFSAVQQRLFLADILAKTGEMPAAIKECDAVIATTRDESDLSEAYALRASLRADSGDFEGAVADYSRCIELDGQCADFFVERAIALDYLDRLEEAVEDCTRALELEPDHERAYNSRGLIRMKIGALDEAMTDLGEAVRLMPEWEQPYMNRATLAVHRNDWTGAVRDYTSAIAVLEARNHPSDRPMLAKLYWNRGRSHGSAGDRGRSEADRRRAMEMDPKMQPP